MWFRAVNNTLSNVGQYKVAKIIRISDVLSEEIILVTLYNTNTQVYIVYRLSQKYFNSFDGLPHIEHI